MKGYWLMIGTIMGALIAHSVLNAPPAPAELSMARRALYDLFLCIFKWGGLLMAMACFKAWWRL